MRKKISLLFLVISLLGFSQKKAIKKVEFSHIGIDLVTEGLDNISIENSESNFVEIYLLDQNPNNHHIFVEEKNEVLTIGFKIKSIQAEEAVFRKFITKRLHRASAIIKVPENKSITIFGDNIDIESKDYKGNFFVFIEKGSLNFNTVQKDVSIKLYEGSIYATLKNTAIDVVSTTGKIIIDGKIIPISYKKQPAKPLNKFTVLSTKANITLTTKKTQ
jgi:hypothetical protein|tara:strand:- start:1295 stop:1948 length:654 start_codon:yes stop_codon:yes gene_type:complete